MMLGDDVARKMTFGGVDSPIIERRGDGCNCFFRGLFAKRPEIPLNSRLRHPADRLK